MQRLLFLPIIILQAVDKTTMYWATNDPFTIPAYQYRHLTVTTKNPLPSGKIEALSNFKLSLICEGSTLTGVAKAAGPLGSEAEGGLNPYENCKNQTTTTNDPDGEWKHRFRNLEPNITYSAYLSATDAAGNSNIFPTFTITYRPAAEIVWPFGLLKPRISPRTVPTVEVSSGVGPDSPEVADTQLEELLQPPPPPPTQRVSPEVVLRLRRTSGVERRVRTLPTTHPNTKLIIINA